MKTLRTKLAFEALEDRRMLTIMIAGENYNPPPVGAEVGFVAPPQDGFAPIALPNGIVPPGATEMSPPPSGELPPGMTQLSGVAETNAVTLAVGWMYTHEDAVGDIVGQALPDSYSTALEVHEGSDFFRYAVAETSQQIAAQYVVRDGAHSEILASFEQSPGNIAQSAPAELDGGLVYAQFDNDLLTALAIQSETAGVVTLWTYPETMDELLAAGSTLPDPGLGSPGSLAALDALVSAHLNGPAAQAALDAYHAAVDRYFALSVPEPSALALAALAVGGAVCLTSARTDRTLTLRGGKRTGR